MRRSRLTRSFTARAWIPPCLFVFDVLEFAGQEVRKRSLLDRKALLEAALPELARVRLVGHIDDGLMLYQVADGLGLEGIVAKRADAPYPRGKSGDWIKIKTAHGRHVDEERAKWNERLGRGTDRGSIHTFSPVGRPGHSTQTVANAGAVSSAVATTSTR